MQQQATATTLDAKAENYEENTTERN